MVGNRLSEVKIDGGGSSPTTVETTHSYRASATGYLDILTGTSSWKSAAGASQQLVEEVAFGYDLNGSMVTRTTTKPDSNGAPKTETETVTWDAAGRLTGFIADDLDPQTPADTTPDLTYTYDTQDRRRERTTYSAEGTPEQTTWTRDESSPTGYDQILAERSDAGTPADSTDDTHTAYLQALTVVAEVSLSSAPGPLFTLTTYLVDHIGSVRAVATAGNVSFTEYDAYGTVIQGGEGRQPNFGFQGERYEQLTKLADHRARFYDTRTGRWASYDSFEADPANPQYLHKYTFGNVNPVNYADPSGNISVATMAVVGISLGIVGSLWALIGRNQSTFVGPKGTFVPVTVPILEVQYHSVVIRTSRPIDDIFMSMTKFSFHNMSPVRADINPSKLGDVITFDMADGESVPGNVYLEPCQGDFSVKVTRFDQSNHSFVVQTLAGHPLAGWRYWGVRSLGRGTYLIETFGVDHRAGWTDSAKWAAGGEYGAYRTWNKYLESVVRDVEGFSVERSYLDSEDRTHMVNKYYRMVR